MKKILLLSIFVMLFSACSSEQNSGVDAVETRSISDYAHLGVIHNDMMVYANNYFVADETIETKEEAINYVVEWMASHVGDVTELAKPSWTQELEFYANNVDARALVNRLRRGETRAIDDINFEKIPADEISFDEAIFVARELQLIDDFEGAKFREIGDMVILNADGQLSNADLKTYLLGVVDEWNAQVYDKNSKQGQALGMTLAISLASLEYWEENPDQVMAPTRALPIVLANDIAGAAVGALVNIYWTTVINDQPVDWGKVGDGALSGALLGSSGVVGKLGKWLSKLF